MPYFLSSENLKLATEVVVVGEEARHLMLSRRLKVGEKIKLQGPDGKRFLCKVVGVGKKDLRAEAEEVLPVPQEPKTKITLFQAYINQAALDMVLQKSTELMANRVVVFNSHNAANRLEKGRFGEKQKRWEKILWEAARQSERLRPPQLGFAGTLDEVLIEAGSLDMVVLTEPTSEGKFKRLRLENSETLGLVVGPEGGFTQEENAKILSLPNSQGVNLGPVLLRAETASLAALAISLDQVG
ncbi:MAG: 16S rRNA (uracil(1498)-N(3))-methyltransferase [Patescibacteria group bacterium]|nr:16S rRNA (uracil(1498)-N(3))-methyltransferase [Patescibacteria group bacterium]